MARVGAAGDNAATESFFSLFQKNVLNRQTWATREELRIAIVTRSVTSTGSACETAAALVPAGEWRRKRFALRTDRISR